MSDWKSQSIALHRSPRRTRSIVAWILLSSFLSLEPAARAATGAELEAESALATETPIGRLEYHAGRGLRIGKTGLTIGGFATANAERLEGGESRGGLEGVNFLLFFDPVPYLHFFSEIETARWIEWDDEHRGPRSGPAVDVDRLYLDAGASDALNLRVGKFLTPIGRWNPAPVEPLVWTTSEPMIAEEVFDEEVTGAMAWGALFPRGGSLSYSFYGTFLDPIAASRDAPPADHSAGAYLEWESLAGWSVGASYFASEPRNGPWSHLGGVDALWQPTSRVELSGEAVFGEGTREEGSLWGLYVQAVVETVPTLFAVGRYERFDPPGSGRAVDLVDVGLAWAPASYLRLKADYLFADHFDGDLAAPGFRASFSVLF